MRAVSNSPEAGHPTFRARKSRESVVVNGRHSWHAVVEEGDAHLSSSTSQKKALDTRHLSYGRDAAAGIACGRVLGPALHVLLKNPTSTIARPSATWAASKALKSRRSIIVSRRQ